MSNPARCVWRCGRGWMDEWLLGRAHSHVGSRMSVIDLSGTPSTCMQTVQKTSAAGDTSRAAYLKNQIHVVASAIQQALETPALTR